MTDAGAPGATPSQTVGPFFHGGLVRGDGHHVSPADDPESLLMTGTVLDGAGAPVSDALVEVWQLDPDGLDARSSSRPGFTGIGRVATGPDGSYRVRVLPPPPTTTVDGVAQAPHLDMLVHARGIMRHLVTRAYVLPADPDDAQRLAATDPVLGSLEKRRRCRLLARRDGDALRFDIRLQGPDETPFFDV